MAPKAKIRTIKAIRPHPDADKLDVVTLMRSQLTYVVEKDSMRAREKTILIEPGSVLTSKLAKMIGVSKVQVKKIRNVSSHGLLLPFSKLLEYLEAQTPKPSQYDYVYNRIKKSVNAWKAGGIDSGWSSAEVYTTDLTQIIIGSQHQQSQTITQVIETDILDF